MAATQLSQEAFDRLQSELDDLRTRGRIDVARLIEAARALGDLSENGDYHAAKDSQGKMESRIRQLQAMLSDVVIVDTAAAAGGEVSTGALVSLRYVG
jgi:transcription elongation factor GreA